MSNDVILRLETIKLLTFSFAPLLHLGLFDGTPVWSRCDHIPLSRLDRLAGPNEQILQLINKAIRDYQILMSFSSCCSHLYLRSLRANHRVVHMPFHLYSGF